jgi:hypothetical protein
VGERGREGDIRMIYAKTCMSKGEGREEKEQEQEEERK